MPPRDVGPATPAVDPAGGAGTAARLEFTLPARSGAPGLARERLRAWLVARQCPPEPAEDLVYAANEAVSNACEHAYRGVEPGLVTVAAELLGGPDGTVRVRVVVRDQGRWAPPDADRRHHGRGLTIMAALTSTMGVLRGNGTGTEVTLVGPPFPAPHA